MRQKLGQHFLSHPPTTKNIADAIVPKKNEIIVEIGPGKGAITKHLLKYDNPVVAIEKDVSLVQNLKEKYPLLNIIEGDVRDNDWYDYIKDKPYIVVANIPYYLTGSLIRNILTHKHPPRAIAFVIQKEVADRIVKRDGKESLLSLSVQLYGTPKYEKKIPAKYFSPKPDVDSALITISNINTVDAEVEKQFFSLITIAFKEKRKVLLKKFQDNKKIYKLLQENGITNTTRAEEVPFSTWYNVAKN